MYTALVTFGKFGSLAFCFILLQAFQENQPAPEILGKSAIRQDRGVIKGKVTDAPTGKGLAKSHVTAFWLGEESSQHYWTVETNSQGNYEISDLPPGKFLVSASCVGYVEQAYGHVGTRKAPSRRPPIALVLRSEEALRDIDFKLIPTGVVEGRILGPDGEPARKVSRCRPRELQSLRSCGL